MAVRRIPADLKQWEPLMVEWWDAAGSDGNDGWAEMEDGYDTLVLIRTIGMVYSVADDFVTLCLSWVEAHKHIGGYIVIPLGMMESIVRLKGDWDRPLDRKATSE